VCTAAPCGWGTEGEEFTSLFYKPREGGDNVKVDPSANVHLHPYLTSLGDKVEAACPGRTAEVISNAIRGALGLPRTAINSLTPAESTVHMIAEQFVIDVHGVTDAQFAALKEHYDEPEIVAMLFRMALADGHGKLERVA